MKYGIIVFFTVFFFVNCSLGTLQAASMPVYERFPPVTDTLNAPTAIALDLSDNLYITESSNNRLLFFSPNGRYMKLISGLDKPLGVAVSSDGRIFITNDGRGNAEVYDSNSALLYKLGSGEGEFTHPVSIAVTGDGTAYVADGDEDTIKVYNPDGSFKISFGTTGSGDGQFNYPTSISINEQSEEIVVSDLQVQQSGTGPYRGARIQFFDMDGSFKRSFGIYGVGEGKIVRPLGVTVDDDGRVYVSDAYQNVVQVFDINGVFLGTIFDSDNPMRTPLGLVFSRKSNRLFVASLNTFKVEVYGIGTHAITVSSTSGGAISPSEIVFVKHGKSQTFMITPDAHHDLVDVRVDGSSVGTVTTYTFNDVVVSHSIEAIFISKESKPMVELVGGEEIITKEEGKSNIPEDNKSLQSDEVLEEKSPKPSEGGMFMNLFSPIANLLKHPFIVGFLIVIGIVGVVKRENIINLLNQWGKRD